ncbi:MAG TPA: energy-coupling factor ABC transporter permease [Bacteroidota bacterium]|nr:energy-coupling factor ABC transporter permease [Bacteroidota bacterium]
MHIPDGFLDAKTALTTGVLSLSGLGAALRQASRHLQPRRIPLIGLTAAFVFVAQMINFPVAGGTSGHLLGAALAVVLVGPGAAVIVMTCVLVIQAFIFADGGLLALGANVLNMAIVAPVCAYGVYRLLRRSTGSLRSQLVAASVAAWFSTVIAAVVCAGELALSGIVPWNLALPAMAGIHSLIGIGEGLITMFVLAAIGNARPELIDGSNGLNPKPESKAFVVYGSICIIAILVLVVPFASKLPDGLEKVAEMFGFQYRANGQHLLAAPLKDYAVPGVVSPALASLAAGIAGMFLVSVLSLVLVRLLVPDQKTATPSPE